MTLSEIFQSISKRPGARLRPRTWLGASAKAARLALQGAAMVASVTVTMALVESTPLLVHTLGSIHGELFDNQRCQIPSLPSVAARASQYERRQACLLAHADPSQRSDRDAAVKAAADRDRLEGGSLYSWLPKETVERWALEGSHAAPSAQTSLGALLAMSAISVSQQAEVSEGRPEAAEDGAAQARALMRRAYPTMLSTQGAYEAIDRDLAPELWLAGRSELFAAPGEYGRLATLRAFWFTQHPALAGPWDAAKAAALHERARAWAQRVPARDGLDMEWVEAAAKD